MKAEPLRQCMPYAVILNLLREKYRSHKQVGIMGGHSMRRDDPAYAEVAHLCRELARSGFVVATGGGPGAMEAANLGAHFANLTDQELNEALSILAAAPTYDDPDGAGSKAANTVLDRWPEHNILSLVSCWLYAHILGMSQLGNCLITVACPAFMESKWNTCIHLNRTHAPMDVALTGYI